jgi:hypothetical protein
MNSLIAYSDFLGLKKPVDLRVVSRYEKTADAYYEPVYSLSGKLKRHKITIYLIDACRGFETLLAHELIHAWQEETRKTKKMHGRAFRKCAKKMELEFNLKELYIPGVDVD